MQPNPLVSSVLSQHPPELPPREAGLTGTSIVARCLSLALRCDKLRNRIIPGGRRWRGRRERGRRRLRDKEREGGRERESDCLSGAGSASLLRSLPLCSFLISACARRRLCGAVSTMATHMHKCDKRMCGCVDGNLTHTRGRSVSPPHLQHVFHGLGLYLEVVLRAVMPLSYAFIHSLMQEVYPSRGTRSPREDFSLLSPAGIYGLQCVCSSSRLNLELLISTCCSLSINSRQHCAVDLVNRISSWIRFRV